MNRLILLFVLALYCTCVGLAQDKLLNNPDNKTYFGVRAGLDLSVAHQSEGPSYNVGPGATVGVVSNVPLVANFYIEPGIKLYYNNYSMVDPASQWVGGDAVTNDSFHKFGFRIPVMAGYHFDFTDDVKLSLFTGPELEVGLVGRERMKWDEGMPDSIDLYSWLGAMNRLDVKWGFGAGLTYGKLYFEASGAIGMCNLRPDTGYKYRENHVSISVGYNF